MKRNQLRSGFAFARFEYTSTYIIYILINISIQAQPLQHMESCKMSRCSRLTVLMFNKYGEKCRQFGFYFTLRAQFYLIPA